MWKPGDRCVVKEPNGGFKEVEDASSPLSINGYHYPDGIMLMETIYMVGAVVDTSAGLGLRICGKRIFTDDGRETSYFATGFRKIIPACDRADITKESNGPK